MNEKRVRIYLDDHVALMVGEIELAIRCRANNENTPLASFLSRLEGDVKAQKECVTELIRQFGSRQGIDSIAKQGVAWFVEKLGRLKPNDSLLVYSSLSRVIELETLAAAALERVALWDNLHAIAGEDQRLGTTDFAHLRVQSQQHLDGLNERRRHSAVEAFAPDVVD